MKGIGCTQNKKKAHDMFLRAAQQGHTLSMHNLATAYWNGNGVEQSPQLAFEWYEKAAAAGFALSQFELAFCFSQGRGTKQNISKALEWLAKAEASGLKEAVVERMYLQADAASQALFSGGKYSSRQPRACW